MRDARQSIPIYAWANVLSLDAVAIGVFWHFVFTLEFCHRTPATYETAILAMSIWLVYTADRLFDSLSLDRGKPHTLRHRIHAVYRLPLVAVWICVVSINTALIASNASEVQLRWGFAAVAAVLVYVAGVHLAGELGRLIPKELQAGGVFAFGVSLSAWSEAGSQDAASVFIATLMAGLLFAANCFLIALWEQDLDRSQNFASWVTRDPTAGRWFGISLIAHTILVLMLYVVGRLPAALAVCLVVAAICLLVLSIGTGENQGRRSVDPSASLGINLRGLFADAALFLPPLLWGIGLMAT